MEHISNTTICNHRGRHYIVRVLVCLIPIRMQEDRILHIVNVFYCIKAYVITHYIAVGIDVLTKANSAGN